MDPERVIKAVFSAIQRHIAEAETAKVRHALPEDIRLLWPPNAAAVHRVKHGDGSMKVADVMTRTVQLASPDDTLEEIAKRMAMEDLGFLPVGENDRLVGMITDRDIVARAVALGRDGQSRVRDAMTADVKYCFEDDSIEDAIQCMSDIQVRRLPVVNRNKRLVGIFSLADAAMKYDPAATGGALGGVTEPGGSHTSSA